jgi:small subunit ribosomal protein S17
MTNQISKTQRSLSGIVVSDKMAKTIVVRVDRTVLHQKYQKRYISSRRYKVHDEKQVAKVGDVVEFTECRPLSKDKRWRLVEVLKKAV